MNINQGTVKSVSATQGKSGAIRRLILGGMMALSLSASAGLMGVAGHAEARVPTGPRLDTLSVACGQLQDRRDAIWAEYSGASAARQQELMTELGVIIQNWVSICQGTFGAIGVRIVGETSVADGLPNVNTVSQNPTGKHAVEVSKLPLTSRSAN